MGQCDQIYTGVLRPGVTSHESKWAQPLPAQMWFSIVSGSSLWVNDCVYTRAVDQVYTGAMRPGITPHASEWAQPLPPCTDGVCDCERFLALGERLCPHPCSVTRFTPALCDQVLPRMRVSRHSLSHPVQMWFSIVSGSSLWVNDCVYTCSVEQVYTGVMRPGIIQHAKK